MEEINNVLIVVDVQNDFVTGSLGSKEAEAILPRVNELINSDEFDIKLFTLDTHDCNYLETTEGTNLPIKHCIKGTWGWEPAFDMSNLSNDQLIEKSQFGTTELEFSILDKLANLYNINFASRRRRFDCPGTRITIVGLCTDICVISNALILKAELKNSQIICDASACAGTTPERHKAALDVMRSCQISVINSEE